MKKKPQGWKKIIFFFKSVTSKSRVIFFTLPCEAFCILYALDQGSAF